MIDLPEGKNDSLLYVYDFGDNWLHEILVVDVFPTVVGSSEPQRLEAYRACPPEDVGGPPGYQEFLAAINDPAHERHKEFRDWMGGGFNREEEEEAVSFAEFIAIVSGEWKP